MLRARWFPWSRRTRPRDRPLRPAARKHGALPGATAHSLAKAEHRRSVGRNAAGGYTYQMPRSWLVRFKALLLVAILLSGGGGMPLLDVALFHGFAPTHLSSPHFEASDSPHTQGELCRLRLALPHAPEAVRLEFTRPLSNVAFRASPKPPDLSPPSADLRLLPQPRAPPRLSA